METVTSADGTRVARSPRCFDFHGHSGGNWKLFLDAVTGRPVRD